MAFPPPSPMPGPSGQMASTFPRVADQLEALARRVQGEGLAPAGPRSGPGGFANVVSHFPAPEDRVAKTHPGLASQLAAIASRVANEDGRIPAQRPAYPNTATTPRQQQPPPPMRNQYSPAQEMPFEPTVPTVLRSGSGSSYTGSEMSSSLETMTQLSRESVRQIGFQHPVNRWMHIKQGPAAVGPAPSQPPPMPALNYSNNGAAVAGPSRTGPPPRATPRPVQQQQPSGKQVAAYDVGRY